MGDSYPKRGDYQYIKNKAEEVFYDPKVATKEIVDEVFDLVNDRSKLVKTLAIAKSAIRHNMAKDLPKFKVPTCIIWGKKRQGYSSRSSRRIPQITTQLFIVLGR
jgi:hypothetical protein